MMERKHKVVLTAAGVLIIAAIGICLLPGSDGTETSTGDAAASQTIAAQMRRFPIQNFAADDVAQSVRAICEMQLHSIVVDERNNVITVSAPPRILDDVARLVAAIDESGADPDRSTHVVTLRNANPHSVEMALSRIFGVQKVSAN